MQTNTTEIGVHMPNSTSLIDEVLFSPNSFVVVDSLVFRIKFTCKNRTHHK